MEKKILWLWLALNMEPRSKIYKKLIDHFGTIEKIFDTDDADVDCLDWILDFQKRRLLDKNTSHAEEVFEWCQKNRVKILTYDDENYPELLKDIPDFPIVLYYLGELPDWNNKLCISVVGTRNMTSYGQNVAYNMGYGLAMAGVIVISGMALGIDSTAQKGTLYAGGTTVAVLGSGIDNLYPKNNLAVFQKIERTGAIITEYPPHTPPLGTNFPVRNRIISGISPATVVVEADYKSGSLITARCAKKQGREVFAVPGPVENYYSAGTNSLIKNGSKVATSATDIVEQFLDRFADKIDISASKKKPVFDRPVMKVASFVPTEENFYSGYKKSVAAHNKIMDKTENKEEKTFKDVESLNENERKIYDFMEYGKLYHADDISVPGLSISDVLASITMLEIAGAIEEKPGGILIKK